ncbi:hypothetical protein KR059_012623 [Drosophila kikkawai]|nr:hypothetical protein KR059_012623 [Drosophila kikkawai]
MNSKVLLIIFSVLLAAIPCAFAQSTTTTEAPWSAEASTESPPASQWPWTNLFQFIKNSTGNKFYFFF